MSTTGRMSGNMWAIREPKAAKARRWVIEISFDGGSTWTWCSCPERLAVLWDATEMALESRCRWSEYRGQTVEAERLMRRATREFNQCVRELQDIVEMANARVALLPLTLTKAVQQMADVQARHLDTSRLWRIRNLVTGETMPGATFV